MTQDYSDAGKSCRYGYSRSVEWDIPWGLPVLVFSAFDQSSRLTSHIWYRATTSQSHNSCNVYFPAYNSGEYQAIQLILEVRILMASVRTAARLPL